MCWKFKRHFLALAGVLLVCCSCVQDSELKPIDPYYLFHDNSSKVWLINHAYKDGKDYSPMSLSMKDIVTIHASHNCYFQRMGSFGDAPGRKAILSLDGATKQLSFLFQGESWDFSITSMQVEKIILEPIHDSYPYTLELIPVPEPTSSPDDL